MSLSSLRPWSKGWPSAVEGGLLPPDATSGSFVDPCLYDGIDLDLLANSVRVENDRDLYLCS